MPGWEQVARSRLLCLLCLVPLGGPCGHTGTRSPSRPSSSQDTAGLCRFVRRAHLPHACLQPAGKGHRGSGSSQDSELESRGGILAKTGWSRGSGRWTASDPGRGEAGDSPTSALLRAQSSGPSLRTPRTRAGRHNCEPVTCETEAAPSHHFANGTDHFIRSLRRSCEGCCSHFTDEETESQG